MAGAPDAPPPTAPAQGLIGLEVVGDSAVAIGTVLDLVVVPGSGAVAGALVVCEPSDGPARLIALPWSELRLSPGGDRFTVGGGADAVDRAPVFVATPLDDVGGERYHRVVADVGAAWAAGARGGASRAPLAAGLLWAALLGAGLTVGAVPPEAHAVGLLLAWGLLLALALGSPARPPAPARATSLRAPVSGRAHRTARGPRAIDVAFEVEAGGPERPVKAASLGTVLVLSDPWLSPAPPPDEVRRLRVFEVEPGGAAEGRTLRDLGLEALGGRALGRWRGDCYWPDPDGDADLAGGDRLVLAVWTAGGRAPVRRLARLGLLAV